MPEIDLSGFSRVWTIEGGANPANIPAYQGLMKIGDPTVPKGDVTRIEVPDPGRYDEFIEVAEVKGTIERPSFTLEGRYPMDVSTLLRLARKGCALDVQAHLGKCRDPRDFNAGWEKLLIFERARITQWAGANFGALGSDERAAAGETADLNAKDFYEVARLTFSERAGTTVTREIISIDVCDTINCGDCGASSDGCQKVLASMIGSGASPGTAPAVVYSSDGGATWAAVNITTLLGNEPPADSSCVGSYYVVASMVDESMHFAKIADILLGAPSWQPVATGFVFGKGPNSITTISPNATWLAGQGGYIYFTADVTQGVMVQEAGVLTAQNLNMIDALDERNVVAVGNSNTVLHTDNGGATWELIVGPAVGLALTAVKMLDADTWLVASTTALVATLWYTSNGGVTWVAIVLPITGARIDDIKLATPSVGYLSLRVTGARAQVLRTIDGGRSWYVLPEGGSAIPNNQRINHIGVCADPNVVFAGGLGLATDGIIIKAA